ncbi:uncharacterized protein LOC110823391 [Carica papaya]|uniref:uncharacterized protein LOC110823391 n=1 Tax=Carica papaya TaxID=3649 RepID=UPI000B8CD8B8|nr:uncharacterized protein LOC110823391 [Carica papaya]
MKMLLDVAMAEVAFMKEVEEKVQAEAHIMKRGKGRSLNVTTVTNQVIERLIVEKTKNENNQASFAEEPDEESKLFMALFCERKQSNNIWFLDSGCSNHMGGTKSLFKKLDVSDKTDVTLGDSKKIRVEGKGSLQCHTHHNKTVYLKERIEQ